MNVLVFKTDISQKKKVKAVAPLLHGIEGIINWNFDLHDCDNILRIETLSLSPQHIETHLQQAGYFCKELE
jgi:hypothetical protein